MGLKIFRTRPPHRFFLYSPPILGVAQIQGLPASSGSFFPCTEFRERPLGAGVDLRDMGRRRGRLVRWVPRATHAMRSGTAKNGGGVLCWERWRGRDGISLARVREFQVISSVDCRLLINKPSIRGCRVQMGWVERKQSLHCLH